MQTTIEIGVKIAVARKLKNLSQAELAAQMAVTPQAVGKWERGESMPDIIAFGKLAEILGVDLNYFGEDSEDGAGDADIESAQAARRAASAGANGGDCDAGWNMSRGNWEDADFSGLSGLGEKFTEANIQKCKFVGSDLSGLVLRANNVQDSDFSQSNLSGSQFNRCNLERTLFTGSDLSGVKCENSNISKCGFDDANFAGAMFRRCNFEKLSIRGAKWTKTVFWQVALNDVEFTGEIVDCAFENVRKSPRISFRDAELRNTFFKYCDLRKAVFENCRADNITLAFLKNSKADISGILSL